MSRTSRLSERSTPIAAMLSTTQSRSLRIRVMGPIAPTSSKFPSRIPGEFTFRISLPARPDLRISTSTWRSSPARLP